MNFLKQWLLKRKEEKAVQFMDKYVRVTSDTITSTHIPYLELDFLNHKTFLYWLKIEENKTIFIVIILLFFSVITGVSLLPNSQIFLFIVITFLFLFAITLLLDSIISVNLKTKLRKKFMKQVKVLSKIAIKETDTESILLIKTTSPDLNKKFESILSSPWLANLLLRLDNIENYSFWENYCKIKNMEKYINADTILNSLFDSINLIRNYSYNSELRYQSFLVKEQIRLDITKTILNEVIKSCGDFNYPAIDILIEQHTFTKQMYQDTIQPLLIELDTLYLQKEQDKLLEEEQKNQQKQAVMEDSKIVLKEVTELARKL